MILQEFNEMLADHAGRAENADWDSGFHVIRSDF